MVGIHARGARTRARRRSGLLSQTQRYSERAASSDRLAEEVLGGVDVQKGENQLTV
jgi:hypothetical protein